MIEDDDLWKQLSGGEGRFFKLNFGFAGYCLFENFDILKTFEKIFDNYVSKKLSGSDVMDYREILEYDKRHWLVQNKKGVRLNKDNVPEKIIINENYDYETWKESNFKGPLSAYRLKSPRKRFYLVTHYKTLIDWTRKLSDLETYRYYERIIYLMFKGFARRRSIPNKTGQEQYINDHVKQEGTIDDNKLTAQQPNEGLVK